MIEYCKHTDLAWAAGIIDADGCISIRHHKPSSKQFRHSDTYSLSVSVGMTHIDAIDKLQDIFQCGNRYIQKRYDTANHRPMYVWQCCSRDAVTVICFVYLWLVTKKRQGKLALRFNDLRKVSTGGNGHYVSPAYVHRRHIYYELMKKYNARGAQAIALSVYRP